MAATDDGPILQSVIQTFPGEVRMILEEGLQHRSSLISNRPHETIELTRFVVEALGLVGNAETAVLLHGFVDDPILGHSAIRSVKRLELG